MKQNHTEHTTSVENEELWDLGLVTAIVTSGINFLKTNRDPRNAPRVGFVFVKTPELDALVHSYFEGTLLIDAKAFWTTSREIKSRIYMG